MARGGRPYWESCWKVGDRDGASGGGVSGAGERHAQYMVVLCAGRELLTKIVGVSNIKEKMNKANKY